MNRSGFSLVELVLILAIIGTLITIGTIDFHSWLVNRGIERQAREMEADFHNLRLTAMYQKRDCVVSMQGGNYAFTSYSSESDASGTPLTTRGSGYNVRTAGGNITFDARGFANISSQTFWIEPTGTGAASDCIVVSTAKINLGKLQNDGKCLFK